MMEAQIGKTCYIIYYIFIIQLQQDHLPYHTKSEKFKCIAVEKDVCYTPQQYLGLLADKFPCILNLEGSL